MTLKEITEALNRLHTGLSGMAPIEPSTSDLTNEEHQGWISQHYAIQGMLVEAQRLAEQTLPPEIQRVFREVRQAGYRLYSPVKNTPSEE
jgi:hypothetical protein